MNVASKFCTKCGASNDSSAGFCGSCGNPFSAQPAPLPPPPPPAAYPPVQGPTLTNQPQPFFGTSPPPPPKKHGPLYWVAVAIAVIVLVIIVVVVLAFFYAVGTSSTVTGINYTSADDACGANGQTGVGFTTSGGGSYQETLFVSGGLLLSCTIHSVAATTSGFTVSGANVPLTVPADGSADLSFTIHVPSNYHGVLTIDIE